MGAPSRLCLGAGGSLTRVGLCLSGPQPRDQVWGLVGGDRSAQGARGWGTPLPGAEKPLPAPPASPKPTLLSPSPARVRGTGHKVRSRSCASPGSGLAVALVDVVLHQSHHLLKLVLQLGPPGRGVCLQGRHDLRGKQGAAGSQPMALAPEAPTAPATEGGGTTLPDCNSWPPAGESPSRSLFWGFPEQRGGGQGVVGVTVGPRVRASCQGPTCGRYLLAYL